MLQVGLTGGIGSGKSTVAGRFAVNGAYVVDFDRLAHQVQERGSPTWHAIVRTFGSDVLTGDGTIDRTRLGKVVFRDTEKLRLLNDIMHPVVLQKWKEQVDAVLKERTDAIVIADIPLLIEVGWQDSFDVVVLVYVSPDMQIRRIGERNGCSDREARDRLNAQMPLEDKIAYADFVIDNEKLLSDTNRRVDEIWMRLLEIEREKRETGGAA